MEINKEEIIMDEETLKILKMVEEGKITADKAQALIEALNTKALDTVQSISDEDIMNKMLKIRVNSIKGDTVNVNLPIKFIKTALKALGKIPIDTSMKGMDKIDFDLISEVIDSGLCGKIVDIHDVNGDNVEVSIE
jgi:hypothetical protein